MTSNVDNVHSLRAKKTSLAMEWRQDSGGRPTRDATSHRLQSIVLSRRETVPQLTNRCSRGFPPRQGRRFSAAAALRWSLAIYVMKPAREQLPPASTRACVLLGHAHPVSTVCPAPRYGRPRVEQRESLDGTECIQGLARARHWSVDKIMSDGTAVAESGMM